MPRTRLNVLIVIVVALAGLLAFQLITAYDHHSAPPQPALTRQLESAAPHDEAHASERPPRIVDEPLIMLGMPRSGDTPVEPVGPTSIGTDSAPAAKLWKDAQAALKAGDGARASELAREGLVLDPAFPQLLVTAAVAELMHSDDHLAEAERLARSAAELAPMYAEAHYNLACALARQKRAAEAATALGEAVRWGRARGLSVVGQALKDPDFAGVLETPEFRAVLEVP